MRKHQSLELAAGLALAILALALPAAAQTTTSAASPPPSTPFINYELSREITVQGIISRITESGGAPSGTHLLIQTNQGVVDAHLGGTGIVHILKLNLAPGQPVHVVGMMANINGQQVLLARILKTPQRIQILRSEHGIPIRASMPHSHPSSTPTSFGKESL